MAKPRILYKEYVQMLSIIISTVIPDHLHLVHENIKSTIGVPFEIISINNSDGKMGLCEVYNKGAERAQFEILCFMHEDVSIKTNDWGRKVIEHFGNDAKLGLLGVAGSTYKSSVFSGWAPYGATVKAIDYANIIQSYKFRTAPSTHYYSNPNDVILQEAAVLDGVWLCTRKEITQKYRFDQDTFKGFHCYDIDISLSIGKEYKVAVIYNVLLEHFSEGKFERDWADATFALHKKWKDALPISNEQFSKQEIIYSEKRSFRNVIPELIKWSYSKNDILTVLKYSNIRKLSLTLYIKLYITALTKHYSSKISFLEKPFKGPNNIFGKV